MFMNRPDGALIAWCRGESLTEGTEVSQVEEVLGTIRVLGRVRVRGQMFNTVLDSLVVLCECRKTIDVGQVPTEVLPVEGAAPWSIIVAGRATTAPTEVAEGTVTEPLMSESVNLTQQDAQAANTTEAILQALEKVLLKGAKPDNGNNYYRRLRVFSGTVPTPAGEEDFDGWRDQALMMIRECDCTDREKRKRIAESVKCPALDILQAVQEANPTTGPLDYVNALETTFGCPDSSEDLFFKFHATQQQPTEKLSESLRCLEPMLKLTVRKGGIEPAQINRAHLDQIIRGAARSELMLLRLRLRERKNDPPSFLTLLKEIREEEEQEATRETLNAHSNLAYTSANPQCKSP
ncbi:paraneoplastic antigen Ma2-like [Polyodon spathula]|uniref:paraneoplastic antigen Ma2-like n=1 Tax=Polyodon spathula TaxID=7913 RepID=UPI001B7F1714|nr:paraneoplastic antigen Ma2-like [Polyodon spathula]